MITYKDFIEKYPVCFFCKENNFKKWIHSSGHCMTMLCETCVNHDRHSKDYAWVQFWFLTKDNVWDENAPFTGFRVCQDYEIHFSTYADSALVFILENGPSEFFHERTLKSIKIDASDLEKFLDKDYLTNWFETIKPTLPSEPLNLNL